MKKILLAICLILPLVFSTCLTFADELDEPIIEEDFPEYVDAVAINPTMYLSGSNAVCNTVVNVRPASNANKAVITVNYLKSGTGTVGTKTVTAYRSNNSFTGITTKALSSHGTYHGKVNIKLYYNSQLIESINVLTNNISY